MVAAPKQALTFELLRSGGKKALSNALAALEIRPEAPDVIDVLDNACAAPRAHVVGLTGPPGVGKSTLVNALIGQWRSQGLTVGVIAVDPSSKRTGGALLGDRTRIVTDPGDPGVFVRSMAARRRLGGLSTLTYGAMILMRALFDVVLIETVGVGQSEADIAQVADSVVFCVQPASGDSLQFMKAGIMEIPHVAAVTKADLGAVAARAAADLEGALSLFSHHGTEEWLVRVITLSAESGDGVDLLLETLEAHWNWLAMDERLPNQRHIQAQSWLEDALIAQYGEDGIVRAGTGVELPYGQSPFSRQHEVGMNIAQTRE